MRAFFGQYGKVVDCTVMVDRESGRSKGFGFVTFEDIPHPEQIIGKIGLVLDDKEVRVWSLQARTSLAQRRLSSIILMSSL